MKDRTALIEGLSNSPLILKELIAQIPEEVLKVRRRPDKWSIHENACHLAHAEEMILERFERFAKEPEPTFNPYIPGDTVSADNLIELDLQASMKAFQHLRSEMVKLLKSYNDEDWNRKGKHPQYKAYDAHILMRHTLMHDHFHMYRIEELWLTRDEYL